MKREFTSRGRRVEIEELDGVVAVKLDHPGESASMLEGVLRESNELGGPATAAGAKGLPLRDGEWNAFRDTGWAFVRPPGGALALESLLAGPVPGASARVFHDAERRLMLGTERLTVRFEPGLSEGQCLNLLGAAGLTVIRRLRFAPNLFEVRVAPGTDFLDVSAELSARGEVEYAEPQFIEHVPPRVAPSDPDYPVQWHLNNTGQGEGDDRGTKGADLDVEKAWTVTRGAGKRIAVIDTGLDYTHPDLAAAVASTSGAFVEDAGGSAKFFQDLRRIRIGRHGTKCAGIATARAENGAGGCGVAHEASLIAITCLPKHLGSQLTLARAIAYAADPRQEVPGAKPADGADVISCSLGVHGMPWRMTADLQGAIDFAVSSGRCGLGTAVFWATDNENVPVSQDEVSSYAHTIAVGRSTNRDLEDGSASGPELDFLATGVRVFTTNAGGGYITDTGTSLAAPAAAAVGALILAVNPHLRWQEVRDILRRTCEKVGCVEYDEQGHHPDYGFGRVNAAAAVAAAPSSL